MSSFRSTKSSLSQRASKQSSFRRTSIASLSQPVPSTSANSREEHASIKRRHSQRMPESSSNGLHNEEENQLVSSLIKYVLVLDRGNQVINKTRITKNVLNGQGGQLFSRVMSKANKFFSEIFGFQLVELEGNKYILVNDIENKLPHVYPSGTNGSRLTLLYLVLTHIFMHEEICTEDALWNFLASLDIPCSEKECHGYFGNVNRLITEEFVAQKYLEKVITEENDSSRIEFKWGARAEYEFSRRAALKFVSQVYNGRPMNSWPLQYKIVTDLRKEDKPTAYSRCA